MASPQGSIVAGIAIAHSGCSSRGPTPADVDRYAERIVRPSDPQTAAARAYYLQNPSLSTCGLTVLGCWRLAGLLDAEVAGAYYPGRVGQAFSNMETVASRYGAWEGGAPRGLLLAGDVWIITDAAGGDGHTGIATTDIDPATGLVQTVEGGQADVMGSTGTGAFTRALRLVGGVWLMGTRRLYGWTRAELLPIPLATAPTDPAPAA